MNSPNYQVFLAWLVRLAEVDPEGFIIRFGVQVHQRILSGDVAFDDVVRCSLQVSADLVRSNLVLPFEETPNLLDKVA